MAPAATPERPLRRDAQRNHDLIVAAARDAFATLGLDASVEEIARRAGVGMGTLYRRFPSKEDLIDAVLAEAFEQYTDAVEQALAVEDPWEGFCHFLERALTLHAQNRGLKDIVASREHGRARADAMRARVRPLFKRLVSRAQEHGALRPDFAVEDLPLLLWAGGSVIEAGGTVAPEAWRRYLGLILDGLRADAATPLAQPPLTRAQLDRMRAR